MAISMLKIRRPLGRLIFNMGIAIPGKTVFLIETAPSFLLILGSELLKLQISCIPFLISWLMQENEAGNVPEIAQVKHKFIN